MRTLSASLKVQMSKGNYLSSLNIRTEPVDFQDEASWERNMDDLILRTAIWQDEHWLNHSAMLKDDGIARDTTGAVKVVLLSARSQSTVEGTSRDSFLQQVRDLAAILTTGT